MKPCPICKKDSLHVYRDRSLRGTVYVGCETSGCHWSQSPTDARIVEAALATWREGNKEDEANG